METDRRLACIQVNVAGEIERRKDEKNSVAGSIAGIVASS